MHFFQNKEDGTFQKEFNKWKIHDLVSGGETDTFPCQANNTNLIGSLASLFEEVTHW